jgi:Beta/Gamma crystallin
MCPLKLSPGDFFMRVSKLIARAAMAGAALLLGATAATARPGIILFKEDNFRGDVLPLSADAPDLSWLRFDDRISSLHVRHGTWLLCSDSHFRGRCITTDHDIARLSRLGMDDAISSVRRVH